MTYAGKYPAIVRSYDRNERMCRVEIPGITDGDSILPMAEIEYPIGDKSRSGAWETEIEILPGDTVWVMFVGGDPRYPLITGWRNPRVGNSVGWRRWHHDNIDIVSDALLCELAGSDARIRADGGLQLQSGGNSLMRAGGSFKVSSGERVQIVGDDRVLIKSNGSSIVLKSATGVLVI